jgi:hypothetical protein
MPLMSAVRTCARAGGEEASEHLMEPRQLMPSAEAELRKIAMMKRLVGRGYIAERVLVVGLLYRYAVTSTSQSVSYENLKPTIVPQPEWCESSA